MLLGESEEAKRKGRETGNLIMYFIMLLHIECII